LAEGRRRLLGSDTGTDALDNRSASQSRLLAFGKWPGRCARPPLAYTDRAMKLRSLCVVPACRWRRPWSPTHVLTPHPPALAPSATATCPSDRSIESRSGSVRRAFYAPCGMGRRPPCRHIGTMQGRRLPCSIWHAVTDPLALSASTPGTGLGGCRASGMPRAGLPGPARLGVSEACSGSTQRAGNDAWSALAAQPGGFERERGQFVVGRAGQTPGMAAPDRLALAPFPLERGACPKPDSPLADRNAGAVSFWPSWRWPCCAVWLGTPVQRQRSN